MRYPENGSWAVEPRPLTVGEQVNLAFDWSPWTVKAVTANFAALTRPADAVESDAPVLYTVLDWRNGVRGPCDLVGQAYSDTGEYTEAECTEMLAEFEAGDLEISQRNWVRIEFAEVSAR